MFMTLFCLALLAGLAVTVYCGVMWILLSRRHYTFMRQMLEAMQEETKK